MSCKGCKAESSDVRKVKHSPMPRMLPQEVIETRSLVPQLWAADEVSPDCSMMLP